MEGAGKVNISELVCRDGCKIGMAELDNPSSLNALSYPMLQQLYEALVHWQHDEGIACVFLHSSGSKAFCAGGDVRSMYRVMDSVLDGVTTSHDVPLLGCQATGFLTDYFSLEYTTDYLIHTYPKPIIVWGDGIVMGGGMGLYIGASHRVMTPQSQLAMPEINIGLYPDVGGTWFLNQLPQGVGLFLGLTGATLNASDALAIGMADHVVASKDKLRFISCLQQADWLGAEPEVLVDQVLASLGHQTLAEHPCSQLLPYLTEIQQVCQYGSLAEVCQGIASLGTKPNVDPSWLQRAQLALSSGSPISAHICYRQIRQYRHETMADCFRLELTISVRCGLLGEFHQGVKARLIEKTGQPQWKFATVEQVDESLIDRLFTPLWADNEHPLQHLEVIHTPGILSAY